MAHLLSAHANQTGTAELGPLSQVHPALKILATFSLALCVLNLQHWPALLSALGLSGLLFMLSGLSVRPTLRKVLLVDGFILVMLLLVPFSHAGPVAFTLGPWSASWPGLTLSGQIALRANVIMLAVLTLLSTLSPAELEQGLQRLAVPRKLRLLLQLTLRYLDLYQQEAKRLHTAMRARGFVARTNRHTWRAFGYLCGQLLVRALDRGERVLLAMRCRGFQDRFPTLQSVADEPYPADHQFLLGFTIALTLLIQLECLL